MTSFLASTFPAAIFIMAGAAVIAAFVTGVFSLTTLVISKEDKVTDSRQKWLEDLRSETSMFLGVIDTLHRLVEPKIMKKEDVIKKKQQAGQPLTKEEQEEQGVDSDELDLIRNTNTPLYNSLNEMKCRVVLRLDREQHRDSKLHGELIDSIEQLTEKFYGSCKRSELDEVKKLKAAIIAGTQKAIRSAWERVKEGEGTFNESRRMLLKIYNGAPVVLVFVLAIGIVYAITQYVLSPATLTLRDGSQRIIRGFL